MYPLQCPSIRELIMLVLLDSVDGIDFDIQSRLWGENFGDRKDLFMECLLEAMSTKLMCKHLKLRDCIDIEASCSSTSTGGG